MSNRRSATPATTLVPVQYERGAPLQIDFVNAVANAPAVYAVADIVPKKNPDRPGPRRLYDELLFVLYIALAGAVGSHRKAARMLGHPTHWQIIRTAARERGVDLPERPPKRANCEDAKRRVHAIQGADSPADGLFEDCRARAATAWHAYAREQGALAPGRRSNAEPPQANTVYGDGKVLSSMYSAKAREKRRAAGHRIDGMKHVQGGDDGTPTHGLKYMLLGVRPNDAVNSRLILDVRYVPKSGHGGEAGIGVNALLDLANAEPGANTVCYDGALRGTHLQQLADAGYLVLSPIHKTTAKPAPLEKSSNCDCGLSHPLFTVDGYAAEKSFDESGKIVFTRCRVTKLSAIKRHSGTHDWYQDIELSCGNRHRLRINKPKVEDQPCRMERLRQAAKDTTDDTALYNRVYGRREDSESANNVIERTMHGGRAISPTATGQYLVMLGHALARNAYARMLWQREQSTATDPPTAA